MKKSANGNRRLHLAVLEDVDRQLGPLLDCDAARPQACDVVADPGESANLAEAQPDVARRLTGEATRWYHTVPSDH